MDTLKVSLLGTAVALTLAGCGSDSDSSTGSTTPVTVSVSDAPIDDVTKAVVTYSKVAFLPIGGGTPQIFDVYKTDEDGNAVDENGDLLPDGEAPIPLSVNLLDYQGGNSIELIKNKVIPTGEYKLCVFANDGDHPTYPSYVVDKVTNNELPLTVKGDGACPQGVGKEANAGVLFFNNAFTVNSNNNDYVVEFDLRRGLKAVTGENSYSLQRTSVSLINTVATGEITGNVESAFFNACVNDTAASTSFTNTNGHAHAVYLYEGNIEQEFMGPFAGLAGMQAPVATANVVTKDNGNTYEYEFGFVAPGTYSISYTCTANDDTEEGIVSGETFSMFGSQSGLNVSAGSETQADFDAL
ncbi:DUF4382 domain-containing protein [Vibrio japonicus]|uniref:DUF4382 domain-containing protein n=1 Tax=Vibrio japonicus TaxID=1824638 RepID=A0ABY5LSG4_9VIBR|nr:DUF4382 domain-containing protein [Vibrio japonicus]UUM32705.1 DUF4382 domain-containing protein [Vibrio japonicus]